MGTGACGHRVNDIELLCAILHKRPKRLRSHTSKSKPYEVADSRRRTEKETWGRKDGTAKTIHTIDAACSLCRVIGSDRIRDLAKKHVYAGCSCLYIGGNRDDDIITI